MLEINTAYQLKKADAAWGAWMHRTYTECAMCGSRQNLEAHHIIGRGNKATRHAKENGIMLCKTCHHAGRFSPHRSKAAFMDWLKHFRPEQYAWAKVNRWKAGKPDYQRAIKELEE